MSGHEPLGAAPYLDWYEPIGPTLEQGDVLTRFPLVSWEAIEQDPGLRPVRSEEFAVILTQSCDIPKAAQQTLLLALAIPYKRLVAQPKMEHFKGKGRRALGEGTAIAELLIAPCPPHFDDYLVVLFRNLFVLPKQYVQANLGNGGVRLRSPYKEYLAQGYARFMMRVGLPVTLHDFMK